MPEEIGVIFDHLDPQTFLPAAPDVDRVQLPAFDTLPHGLTRDAQTSGGLPDGHITLAGLVDEAGA